MTQKDCFPVTLLSKTGMGSYTYGSSSRPHAVTEVDNTDGSITLQVQDVGFNDWNKMSFVWAYDEHDFYRYSLNYGPDLRRVTSEMHRTYQELYEKFYWDDFEEKVVTMRGTILNDTTFHITRGKCSDESEYEAIDYLYRFRQTDAKPDSTNKFFN